jgi:hypothetical protein
MPTSIFVSYPSADLERSQAFCTAIGASINPLFTDENAVCLGGNGVWEPRTVDVDSEGIPTNVTAKQIALMQSIGGETMVSRVSSRATSRRRAKPARA